MPIAYRLLHIAYCLLHIIAYGLVPSALCLVPGAYSVWYCPVHAAWCLVPIA